MITNAHVDVVLPHAISDLAPEGHDDHGTERENLSQAVAVAGTAFEAIFDMAPVPMMITTGTGRIEYMNAALQNLLGYDIEDLQKPSTIITHADDLVINNEIREHLRNKTAGAISREKRYIKADGEVVHAILSIAAQRDNDGNIIRLFSQITDVTEQKENEERIRVLSSEDSLTGLYNRRAFLENCELTLRNADASQPHLILFLDINRFKTINDSLGHRTGDIFLRSIALRIQHSVPDAAIVGRLGGDEFAILIPGDRDAIVSTIDKLRDNFREPIGVHKIFLSASASIGVAMYPEHGTNLEHLLACADTAMYQAKNKKIAYQVFDGHLDALNARWLEIEPLLRKTIQSESFRYAYQNIYNIRDGKLEPEMREALVRWQYQGKVVAPNDFIPLAEETGLIRDIDRASVRCTARDWIRNSESCVRYTVNVSALTLNDHGFLDFLDQNIQEGLIKPESTVLEITETAVLSSTDQLLEILSMIRTRGFHLAIDDFGAGQTSIGLLSRIPADYIKLDRKLADHVGSGGVEETIVRALIDIAHDLNMAVICEGVETCEQLDWLAKVDCDYAQGYLLHRPELLVPD